MSLPTLKNKKDNTNFSYILHRFAECTILDVNTGELSVYSPLLVGPGETAVPPTVPTLPINNVVGCWFGSNIDGFTKIGEETAGALANVGCVNGDPLVPGDMFGQFAACHAQHFFTAAKLAIAAGKLKVPPIGTGTSGHACYMTRNFELVDQDPNDNVITKFLSIPNGGTTLLAQKNPANKAKYPNATVINNASDEGLRNNFFDVVFGCTPYTAKDLADPSGASVIGSLALNELQGGVTVDSNPNKTWAFIPPQDPMVLSANGSPSRSKQNAYRAAVNQPRTLGASQEQIEFCKNMLSINAPSIIADLPFTFGKTSPTPSAGKDMFTFLGQRFPNAFTALNCNQLLKMQQDPVTANRDANGVAVSITFHTPALQALVKKTIQQFPQAASEALV